MLDKQLLDLDLIHSKLAYILACMSSYSFLDLSKRIIEIMDSINKIKQSLIDNKRYIDIRDAIKLRNDLKELESKLNDDQVSLQGHKIACLLFEISTIIKIFMLDFDYDEDMKEYLEIASKYLFDCGRIINIEILCFENK